MTVVAQASLPGDPGAADQLAPDRQGTYRRYVLSRCLGALGSLAFMLVVSFFLFRVLPGDPARTLGPMIVAGRFEAVWVYILAPIVGAVLAAFVYDRFASRSDATR